MHPSLLRLVAARMDECLKKGADARKSAIALGSLEYSGDLSKQLMQFSDKMEKVFKILQDLRSRKISDPDQYSKYFDILDEKMQWYNKADVFLLQHKTGSGFHPIWLVYLKNQTSHCLYLHLDGM
jgi:methionyl-tRNA formyltransferase